MKALILNDDDDLARLKLVERPILEPQRQQVLIRLRAAALNYRDVEIARGSYHTRFPAGLVPLSDGVGDVIAVGADVTRAKVGDRVSGTFWQRWVAGPFDMAETGYQLGGPLDGMLGEYALLDEQGLVHVPATLSDAEAATLPCAAVTAWHSLVSEGGLRAGETVLLQGTGGVSLFALQFAKASGARAIVTSSSDDKLAQAQALGAYATINYRRTPDWAAAALDLTDGRGVDHVLEVGGPASFAQSLRATRLGGQISVIGYLGGTEGAINPLDIFRRQLRVRGIPVGSRASFETMNRAIAANDIKPVIGRRFFWKEAAEALAALEGGAGFGKVVLDFEPS